MENIYTIKKKNKWDIKTIVCSGWLGNDVKFAKFWNNDKQIKPCITQKQLDQLIKGSKIDEIDNNEIDPYCWD